MGSITDAGVLDRATLDRVVREVVEPTLQGARDEGFPFRGVLFIGLMLTADGPRVSSTTCALVIPKRRRFWFG